MNTPDDPERLRSRRPTRALAALLTAVACAWPAPALAQSDEEVIVDPDNPDAAGGDEEVIVDPDNPDGGGGGQVAGDEEVIADPDNPGTGADQPVVAPVEGGSGDGAAPFGGYVRGRWRVTGAMDLERTEPSEDIYELHNLLELRTRQQLGVDTSAVLEARLRHALLFEYREQGRDALPGRLDDVERPRGLKAIELMDAYVSTRWDRLLLRVGQQRVVWGSAELTRPADVVNPLDLAAPLGGDGFGLTPTVPVFAVKADWVGELGTVQGVLLPFFEPHRTALLSTDFSPAAQPELQRRQPLLALLSQLVHPSLYERVEGALVGTELPDETLLNPSAGLRLSTHAGPADLAVSYLYAFDRVPVVVLDPTLSELIGAVASDGQVLNDFDLGGFFGRHPEVFALQSELSTKAAAGHELLSVTYARWHVVAFDSTVYVGPIGVRADVAWSPERTFVTEAFTSVRRPAVNSALNLAWEGDAGEFAVVLEGVWLHVFDGPTSAQERIFLFGNDFRAIAGGLLLDLEPMAVALPLSFQLGGLVDLDGADAVLSASASWKLSGQARLGVGVQAFTPPLGGRETLSLGGLFDPNDQAWVSFELGI